MSTPKIGDKFKHLLYDDHAPGSDPDGSVQLPNEFTVVGISDGNGSPTPEDFFDVMQTGQVAPLPTRWEKVTFGKEFEPVK